jgi:CheY-like chemotaxis protein
VTAAGRDPAAPAVGAAAPSPLTVLLVEDNEDNRVIYATYLTHFGYAVLTAEDAEEGLALARDRRPDLIVMDVGLPGMDGNAATRLLKADPTTERIPVVTLTAHAHREDRDRAEAAGCDLYLTKPLEPRELGAAIRRLLGQAAP